VVSPGEPGSRPGEQPEGQKALEGCLPVKRWKTTAIWCPVLITLRGIP
jgi:hypothetical protein